MTAPVLDPATDAPPTLPPDSKPVRLLLAVEGITTSDGRFIVPGVVSTRPMPLPIFAQVRSTHGSDGDTATYVVGAVTSARRVSGMTLVQRSTGRPFPAGTFCWVGEGWMYTDAPTPESGSKPAYTLMRDGALYGNSVDLTELDATAEYASQEAMDADRPSRIVVTSAVIAQTTIVGIPAFMDCYVEVPDDSGAMVACTPPASEALTAAALAVDGAPLMSWRATELGDVCGACRLTDGALEAFNDRTPDAFQLPPLPPPPAAPAEDTTVDGPPAVDHSQDAMLCLVPEDPSMLAVPGGDPAGQLHLTLAYLGDQVAEWAPEHYAALHKAARIATDRQAWLDDMAERYGEDEMLPDATDGPPGTQGPIDAGIFAHAVFNPAGPTPATVYLLDGTADREDIHYMASSAVAAGTEVLGALMAEQHQPYVPHVTAGYGLPVDQLAYTGPVRFTALRLQIGDTVTDYPLGGGAITASAAELPPASIFANPQLKQGTPVTVRDDKWRSFAGHLAEWNSCHIGIPGRCEPPPRSAAAYGYFLVHSTRALDAAGNTVAIPVGYGTLDANHASLTASNAEAVDHYANTAAAVFEMTVGEDEHGIWCAGRMLPGLDALAEHKARGVAFSGDWRPIRGNRELVAALGVNTPGFAVLRIRNGQPGALVAALNGPVHFQNSPPAPEPTGEPADAMAWLLGQYHAAEGGRLLAELTASLSDAPDMAELFAEHLAAVDAELAAAEARPA